MAYKDPYPYGSLDEARPGISPQVVLLVVMLTLFTASAVSMGIGLGSFWMGAGVYLAFMGLFFLYLHFLSACSGSSMEDGP